MPTPVVAGYNAAVYCCDSSSGSYVIRRLARPYRNRRRSCLASAPGTWVTLAIVGLLLIGLAMFLRGLERPAEWVIAVDDIAHMDGRAWIVNVRDRVGWPWQALGGDQYDPFRSDLQLFEEGRRLEPHRAALEVITTSGGGAYTHWGRRLWFSTSDGSDPRSNGREYRATFTAASRASSCKGSPKRAPFYLLSSLAGFLWTSPPRDRGRALRAGAGAAGRMHGTGLLAAVIPAALAWLAWTHLPPLWNSSDSLIWLLWQLTLFPHHAPAYPLMMHFLERATWRRRGDAPGRDAHSAWPTSARRRLGRHRLPWPLAHPSGLGSSEHRHVVRPVQPWPVHRGLGQPAAAAVPWCPAAAVA